MAERMMIELSPDVQSIVQEAVDAGDFGTHEEFVAAAVRAWRDNDPNGGDESTWHKLQEAVDRKGPYHTADEAYARLIQRYRDWPQQDTRLQ